jgi:hypothetical protein
MTLSRSVAVHVLAVAAYVAVAVAFTWPLPRHYQTHLLGDPTGDTGVYVWNLWVFRHELIEHGHWPFRTDMLFVPTSGVGLGLHNYTVLADIAAVPIQRALGVVATFNVIQWLAFAANAYGMFLLARHLTRDTVSALLAGAAFGFSPFLVTRATAHQSLLMAFPLPIFLLLLLKARESGRYVYAAAAGLALGAAALCDAYYGMFGLLIGAWVLAASALAVVPREAPASPGATKAGGVAGVVAVLLALVVAWIAMTGGTEAAVGGRRLVLRTLYTPVLLLTVSGLVWAGLLSRRRLALRPGIDWGRSARLVAAALAVTLLVCLPVVHAMVESALAGRYVQPEVNWRSSPPGVDALALVLPNPNHAGWSWPWLNTLPNGYVENVASQSLLALGAILAAWILDRRTLPAFWAAFTAFFVLLALGPFIHIAGANTCVPTPWALLRYVPVLANARSPTRFAVVATLGIAVLLAFAVRALLARVPSSLHRGLAAAAAGAVLLFELAPAERRLFSAEVPSVYATIAADPRPVSVLELPFGVRSGASNAGDFSAFSMFGQTVHGKPLLGGYLSRVSEQRIDDYRAHPMTDAFLRFSSGQAPNAEQAQAARDSRKDFLRETRLGYVVVDTHRASVRMQRFAANALHLEPVGADGKFDLYAVVRTKLD